MRKIIRDGNNCYTFADAIGAKHCNWARCKALSVVEDKWTETFCTFSSA